MVKKKLFRYLKDISEPKYFSQGNFRPFPTLNFFGGILNEGSSASGVTVNLATGMESSWWETISVELPKVVLKGIMNDLKKPRVFPSMIIRTIFFNVD